MPTLKKNIEMQKKRGPSCTLYHVNNVTLIWNGLRVYCKDYYCVQKTIIKTHHKSTGRITVDSLKSH